LARRETSRVAKGDAFLVEGMRVSLGEEFYLKNLAAKQE